MARVRTKNKNKATKAKDDSEAEKNPAQPWFFYHPDPIVRFTGWVAFFALMAVVVGALQWCTLQQANRINQVAFRPKLWLTNKNADPKFVPIPGRFGDSLGQWVWTWEFTNFGQGTATDVSIDSYIKLEDGPFYYTFGKQGPARLGDIPPGAVNFATITSEPMIKSYGESLLEEDLGVSFLIVFNYKDDVRTAYETVFCVSRYQNGTMPYLSPTNCKNQIEERPQ